MTMSEVEVDRITQQVFAARNSGLDAALVKVVIDEIEAATTTEAMLATLVERGVLEEEARCGLLVLGRIRNYGTDPWADAVIAEERSRADGVEVEKVPERRFVTPWEVAW